MCELRCASRNRKRSVQILPPTRPVATPADLGAAETLGDLFLVGARGYYSRENKRGMYDDAIFIIHQQSALGFNANTDPSVFRPGIATLECGVWRYRIGIHGLSKPKSRQYEALVQAEPVLVTRDGGKAERGWFGINIHRGSRLTTSSLGCQTIWPDQWSEFITTVKLWMGDTGQKTVRYILMERQGTWQR